METENSCATSIDLIEPTESNDSKEDSSAVEEKVIQISDESSNGNDDKKDQMIDKIDIGECDESQSVKSSVDESKDASSEDVKETRAFQGIQSNSDTSTALEKDSKTSGTIYHVEDSDEDPFEDAKENHDDSAKTEKETESEAKKSEKSSGSDSKSGPPKSGDADEVAGSVDSDDEVLEVKVSRSTGRKKTLETLKTDTPNTPSSSTRSRDHSENDDNRDAAPIRTRSRNSSVVVTVNEPKAGLTKEQDHSFWKGRWEDCQKDLHKHKDYTSVIDNKMMHDDSYKSIVLRPMTMKTIQKNIDNSISTMPGDIKRDFALMCSNIMMMNKRGSKFNEIVYNFMRDGFDTIDQHMDVDDVYVSYRKQIRKKH
jgi:Bromodomain